MIIKRIGMIAAQQQRTVLPVYAARIIGKHVADGLPGVEFAHHPCQFSIHIRPLLKALRPIQADRRTIQEIVLDNMRR